MKVKRTKRVEKLLTFYKYKYNFVPPYQVLIDGTVCQAALQERIILQEQIENYLPDHVKLLTTKCVLEEMEKIGGPLIPSLTIMKKFKVVHCPHTPARTARDCLVRMARRSKQPNKPKYIIATQDIKLLEELRDLGGIPLLSIRSRAILLEKPSEASLKESAEDIELAKVKEMKMEILGEDPEAKAVKKKKKKGANPLSMLKSKKKIGTIQKKNDGEKKKTRRKKKKAKFEECWK